MGRVIKFTFLQGIFQRIQTYCVIVLSSFGVLHPATNFPGPENVSFFLWGIFWHLSPCLCLY